MQIKEDFYLAPFNTFGLEILARKLSIITSVNNLNELFFEGQLTNNKVLVLSKGSNVLFTSHFDGLVLLNKILGKEIIEENEESVLLKVSSGEFWPSLVEYTIDKNWGGLENMTDIPGKVGAAPVQNIGAYGSEIKDVLISLEAFDLVSGKVITFTNAECNFGYRTSIFKTSHKNRYFITSITVKLSKNPKVNLNYKPLSEAFSGKNTNDVSIKEVSDKIAEIRRLKIPNPDNIKNAGSFFKNAIINQLEFNELKANYRLIPSYQISKNQYKLPAAWLIEQCGWKGKKIGNVGTYDKQALIIINFGKATGSEIMRFANSIQQSVFDKFGINLELEVNVI